MPASVSLMAALTKLMARSRCPPLLGVAWMSSARAARSELSAATMLGWLAPAAQAPARPPMACRSAHRRWASDESGTCVSPDVERAVARPFTMPESTLAGRYRYLAATDRLAADVTALSDAVTMLESMPTPHSTRPSLVSASMKLTAWASDPAPVACW